uniref:Ig-like domain-containing protein n=1 Tax=Labrus bergylta TaxID=56723 RepID=A0A3Q3GID7_9LABR
NRTHTLWHPEQQRLHHVHLYDSGLLAGIQAQGTPVFVQTGTDLLLEVQEPVVLERLNVLTWRVNDSVNVVKLVYDIETVVSESYKSRAEFSAQNHSLLLKNVQKRDSGVYRASVSGDKEITVAEYSVTVLDPVSGVKLTVKLCSSDSTKVTVICSTEDSLISSTFTCDNQTCSHEGGERAEIITPGASLDVYLENGSVICNHSNQVSSTRDIQKIEDLCVKPIEISGVGFSIYRLKIYVVSIGLVIMMCAVISVHVVEKLKKKKLTTTSPPTILCGEFDH